MPSVSASKSFETIDNLLINYAGNYSSADFDSPFSDFIIKHFKLNIDLDPNGQPNFKHLKEFDYNLKKQPVTDLPPMSKKKAKRLRYPIFQFLFKKNRSLAYREALDGVNSAGEIDPHQIKDFWTEIMGAGSGASLSISYQIPSSSTSRIIDDATLWASISVEELSDNPPHLSSAVGPDGLTAHKVVSTPRALLCRILNCFMLARRVPSFLAEAKKIFIPKTHNASSPGELRLICLSSLLHRLFHRVLANRISGANNYVFQFGFRNFDGTGTCVSLTDFLIKYARKNSKNLHMAFVDLR